MIKINTLVKLYHAKFHLQDQGTPKTFNLVFKTKTLECIPLQDDFTAVLAPFLAHHLAKR